MGLKTITREALERAMVADPLFFEGLDLRPKRQAGEEYEEAREVIEAELEEEAMYAELVGKVRIEKNGKVYWKPNPIYQEGERDLCITWLCAASLICGDFCPQTSRDAVGAAMNDDSEFFERAICELYPRIAYLEDWTNGDLLWLGLKKHSEIVGPPWRKVRQ